MRDRDQPAIVKLDIQPRPYGCVGRIPGNGRRGPYGWRKGTMGHRLLGAAAELDDSAQKKGEENVGPQGP